MKKCILKKYSKTIDELEEALDDVNVKLGHIGEVTERIERCGTIVLVKIKLPYFASDNPFDKNELFYTKRGYIGVLLPYDCIAEVEDEEQT